MGEVIPSSLNLFSQPSTLYTTRESHFERINTKTALDSNVAQLEFTANPDKIHYTSLSESVLMLKVKYQRVDGAALPAEPFIGPVNNLLTSMFRDIQLFINDILVSPNESNVAYVNFLHMFTQSQNAKKSYLTTSLYYEDSFKNYETVNQPNPQAANNPNKGLQKRAKKFGGGKEVVLIGKVYIAPHNTERPILTPSEI